MAPQSEGVGDEDRGVRSVCGNMNGSHSRPFNRDD